MSCLMYNFVFCILLEFMHDVWIWTWISGKSLLFVWCYEYNLEIMINWWNWVIIDVYVIIWLLYNMYLWFFVEIGVLGSKSELWMSSHGVKCRNFFLQQPVRHHERDGHQQDDGENFVVSRRNFSYRSS